jgi:hypothetical protein
MSLKFSYNIVIGGKNLKDDIKNINSKYKIFIL